MEQNFRQWEGGLCPMVQPIFLYIQCTYDYTHTYNYIPYWTEKVPHFIYLFLINGVLYLFYSFILPHKMYKEKKQFENTLQNESGEEALNRNCRAYNVNLP